MEDLAKSRYPRVEDFSKTRHHAFSQDKMRVKIEEVRPVKTWKVVPVNQLVSDDPEVQLHIKIY